MNKVMNMDEVTREFIETHADDTSNILASHRQKMWYGSLVFLFVGGLIYRWDVTLCIVNFLFAFIYFCIILFRTLVVLKSLAGNAGAVVSAEQIDALKDADLPMFTILVPLYHESNVADKIVHYLNKLDYPEQKLDIKLLLEEDDDMTISAVRSIALPSCYDVIIVPDFLPKTKPKACNHGLKKAKGAFCVIYDAEDRPDPDQLKKVLCVFRSAKEEVVCVQAKLNFYNPKQNLLTRFFTIEYSTTFDLFLPGLQRMNVPMPLGGTSNHFRTAALKKIGGWDPFNVTEDCDLGVRL
ncbi:MAG: glycosyltransferase [Kiritimatiellae bacterium]|nr:glycosyltransferase [Kiritimatiellia bacterium]